MSRRYALITPCRDEAEFLTATITSIAAQTVKPVVWIVVDDGSTDDTPRILAEASKKLPFLKVIRREDRGRRAVGPGVIEAFYEGLSHLDRTEVDYLCKLDGDLEIPPRYFERLMVCMEEDPWLGTVSGKLYLRYGDELVEERCGDENSVGPSKFYRSECFDDIGGFVRQVSWDGIDGHVCRLRGWVARSYDEPDLRLIHLRRMGSSQKNFWTGRLRWGMGKYFMGSSLAYVVAASCYRMFERPWLLSGLGILAGYLRAMIRREARYDDPAYLRSMRRFERLTLLLGRRRALEKVEAEVRSRPPHHALGRAPIERSGAERGVPPRAAAGVR